MPQAELTHRRGAAQEPVETAPVIPRQSVFETSPRGGGQDVECKGSPLAATMLPKAALQPASLLTQELGRQEHREDTLAEAEPHGSPQSLADSTGSAGSGESAWDAEVRALAESESEWAAATAPASNRRDGGQRLARAEAAHSPMAAEAHGLGRLEEAVRSDLMRLRAAGQRQWQSLQSRLPTLGRLKQGRLRWALIAAAVLYFTPIGSGIWSAAEGSMSGIGEESRTRAAFQFIDDFREGTPARWDGDGLTTDGETTAIRAASLSLFEGTMDLTDYFMDFDFILDRPSLGWVVRANDRDSYCAFKIQKKGRPDNVSYMFVRYPVIDGEVDTTQKVEVDVTPDFRDGGHNRVSVRIAGQRVKTFLNGRSVDFWNDELFHAGGIGFWNESGTSGQLQRVAVYGNEDFWGLTLYAAFEAANHVKQFFGADKPTPEPTQAQNL